MSEKVKPITGKWPYMNGSLESYMRGKVNEKVLKEAMSEGMALTLLVVHTPDFNHYRFIGFNSELFISSESFEVILKYAPDLVFRKSYLYKHGEKDVAREIDVAQYNFYKKSQH